MQVKKPGRPLKCYGTCGSKHFKEEMVKVGALNYCKPCAAEKIKEQKDREVLYKTLQTTFKIPYPNGQMLKQIAQFKADRNYTYEGMTKTICYFIKVQRKVPFINGALSFLPYHYDNAIKYYDDLEEKRKNTHEVDNKVSVLKIAPIKSSTDIYKQKKIINMEAILNDG